MSRNVVRDAGSFRDPDSYVFHMDGRVLRTVAPQHAQAFAQSETSRIVQALVAEGKLIASLPAEAPPELAGRMVIEHPKLPFISYPYEWTFAQLRKAALLHLHIQRRLLADGLTLSDASAYNIQFVGEHPLFIDRLSLVPYQPGELWRAHGQFVSHFLVPLLLGAQFGIAHGPLFLAYPEGIPPAHLHRLMPWRKKFSFRYFAHIGLPVMLQKSTTKENTGSTKLSPGALDAMLAQLEGWIESLRMAPAPSAWNDYYDNCHYDDAVQQAKRGHVARIVRGAAPARLIDIGGNDASYSVLALENGAGFCISLDSDQGAATQAYAKAASYSGKLLTLCADICQPSPAIGWNGCERASLLSRLHGDLLLALGLMHHLSIARGIPVADILDVLLAIAPEGIIEWVDGEDAMSQRMLAGRKGNAAPISSSALIALLEERTQVIEVVALTPTRQLVHYRRK